MGNVDKKQIFRRVLLIFVFALPCILFAVKKLELKFFLCFIGINAATIFIRAYFHISLILQENKVVNEIELYFEKVKEVHQLRYKLYFDLDSKKKVEELTKLIEQSGNDLIRTSNLLYEESSEKNKRKLEYIINKTREMLEKAHVTY